MGNATNSPAKWAAYLETFQKGVDYSFNCGNIYIGSIRRYVINRQQDLMKSFVIVTQSNDKEVLNMINLYIAPSSASSRKARAWLKEHDIAFKERNIKSKPLNAAEVKQILRLTENGSEDIISTRSNVFKQLHVDLDSLSVSQLVDLVVKYPDLIKRPIIFDDKRLEVGYNEEEIRRFLPRDVRTAELHHLESQLSS